MSSVMIRWKGDLQDRATFRRLRLLMKALTLAQRASAASAGVAFAVMVASAISSASAEEAAKNSNGQPKSADEVARELANPNSSLASLTFKNQYRWYKGDLPKANDQENYTLLFQPVFPFPLGEGASDDKANIFIRPAFPLVIEQPTFDLGTKKFQDVTALGDIGFDLAYGVTTKSGLLWAVGMVGTLPTATDARVAGKQLRLGPEALIAKFEKWGIYGLFPSHQWDVAGWSQKDYSNTQMQAFLVFLPGGGWSVGTTPIMNYDWESKDWTVPLNLTISRTINIGNMPLKVALEVNYYVAQPDAFGPKVMVGLNFTPVVKNFVNSWIRGN